MLAAQTPSVAVGSARRQYELSGQFELVAHLEPLVGPAGAALEDELAEAEDVDEAEEEVEESEEENEEEEEDATVRQVYSCETSNT